MLIEQIKELYNHEDYSELEQLLTRTPKLELIQVFSNSENKFLLQLLMKISPSVSAEVFLKLSKETQHMIVHELSYIQFKHIANELLDNDAEELLNPDIFNEILLKAKTENRNDKLVEIIDKFENKEFSSIKPILSKLEPVDIAEIFNECNDEKVSVLFRLLPKDLASEVFVEMDSDNQEMLIKSFTDKELETIINDLFVDDTVDIIEEMPSNVVTRILKVTEPEARATINRLLKYPKDSAGSIMTTEFVTIKKDITVHEALKKIRQQAINKETIYTCYVTDEKKHLIGIISAKDLILHEPTDIINSFMDTNVISASTKTDREEVSNMLSKYDMLAIPIVDDENRINGIVTIDDAIDVIKEEANEDIGNIAHIGTSEKPYLQTNPFKICFTRFPWLFLLLISATFTGLIINTYEGTLNSLSPLLFACVPMLMGSGGNAGSQASATIIRALSLDEVEFKDILKVIWKELRVGLMLAFALSICCFIKLQLIDNLIFGYDYNFTICLAVSASLFFTICISKIVGASLSLIAKKLKLDPAVVASPFIATIVDAVSLIIYCNISVMLLS